jgi:phosphatidylcholine synthase
MLKTFYTSPSVPATRLNLLSAWLVHLYTASGALCAFFGALAVSADRYREALLWMVAATAIDATDGLLARRARVKERLPGFDGARLDDVVDYLTFVFLPVLFLHRSGALPEMWSAVVLSVVLLSSAYGFSASDAKTSDQFFTGFPSYWNIVAVYLHIAALPPAANAVVLLLLSGLVFWRIGYVYPSRTPTLRTLTVVFGVCWGINVLLMVLALPDVPRALFTASFAFPLYYTVLSFVLHRRRLVPARR